ncbi:MAG: sialidase family protein [Armatimonadota bacterium]
MAVELSNEIVLSLPHGPNNPRNSEGAFITLADGRVLFVYTHYYGDSSSDHASAYLAGRSSADGGRSWSAEDRLVQENEGDLNVMSVSLLRLQDGRIALFYLRKNADNTCILRMRASTDEAETWSEAVDCIPSPGYYVVNNDRVVQLQGGRIVVPATYHRMMSRPDKETGKPVVCMDGRSIALCFLSDDGGATWREGKDWWALPVRGSSGLQEMGAVELKDGRLYGYCRTSVGWQYEMQSSDGGETWTAPQPSPFQSPCSPLSIKRIPSTGDLLAVWNDHSGELAPIPWGTQAGMGWRRNPLVTAVSSDEARTWTHKRVIECEPDHGYCYTAIHFVEDAVLLAYCCGGGQTSRVLQDLCVRRMTADELYTG